MAKIDIEAYLARIETLISENSLEQAIYHCFYLLRQFPKYLTVYKSIGRIFFEMNQFQSANDVFSRIIAAEPENFLNHLTMGFILEELKDYDAAIYQTRLALFLQPENKDVIGLYQRLTSQAANQPEPECFKQLLAGIHYYHEKEAGKAVEELQNCPFDQYEFIGNLYLGLSLMDSNQPERGIEFLENALEKAPYLQIALRKACAYWQDKNPQRYSASLNRLCELNPNLKEFDFSDGFGAGKKRELIVIYQDWTGFQNSRLRTVWQQPGSKIIDPNITALPNWLQLLPVCAELTLPAVPEPAAMEPQNAPAVFFNTQDRRKNFSENDVFFQTDYFKTQLSESQSISQPSAKPAAAVEPESILEDKPAKNLEAAFDLLEKIVTEGVEVPPTQEEPAETTAEMPAEIAQDTADTPPTSETSPTAAEAQEQTELLRSAWNCFSAGEQEKGVALYQELIEKNIRPEQVREDLQKLTILFPENDAIKNLTQT